jgi:hypothetical protein
MDVFLIFGIMEIYFTNFSMIAAGVYKRKEESRRKHLCTRLSLIIMMNMRKFILILLKTPNNRIKTKRRKRKEKGCPKRHIAHQGDATSHFAVPTMARSGF